MKYLLSILCLFIFSCDSGGGDTVEVHGCADSQACNYNPDTTIDNNSCEYAEENFDCDGNCLVELDCNNECGGTLVEDECGICDGDGIPEGECDCDGNVLDCADVCGGDAVLDECDVCGGDGTIENSDCDGNCLIYIDCDGVCGGSNTNCEDCNGVQNGTAYVDNCGVCDDNSSNDCVQDCLGIWGGSAVEDECGVCNGSGIPQGECDCDGNTEDCDGVCGGSAVIDDCEVCNGGNASQDCAGTCNGTAVEDCLGVCGGVAVEDCAGTCNGVAIVDCEGVCNGNAVADACGQCGEFPTCITDIDGNIYQTIQIGNQLWMKESLKVTHYNNGNLIDYSDYEDDSSNSEIYGRLYTGNSVIDERGICPLEWHIPSDDEWKELESYLGMEEEELDLSQVYRGTNQGSQLAGNNELWLGSGGGLENNSDFGLTGFDALPSGAHYNTNNYTELHYDFYVWSGTSGGFQNQELIIRHISWGDAGIRRAPYYPDNKFAVRCIQD